MQNIHRKLPPSSTSMRKPRRNARAHWSFEKKFWVFVVKYENQEVIWLKFHKSPRFNNSKGSRIVGGKLVPPAIHCWDCFCFEVRVRLPTPVLKAFACWKTRSKSYWYNYNARFFMIFSWSLWCNTFVIFSWLLWCNAFVMFSWSLWCNTFHVYYFTVITFVLLHEHSPPVV